MPGRSRDKNMPRSSEDEPPAEPTLVQGPPGAPRAPATEQTPIFRVTDSSPVEKTAVMHGDGAIRPLGPGSPIHQRIVRPHGEGSAPKTPPAKIVYSEPPESSGGFRPIGQARVRAPAAMEDDVDEVGMTLATDAFAASVVPARTRAQVERIPTLKSAGGERHTTIVRIPLWSLLVAGLLGGVVSAALLVLAYFLFARH